MKERLGKDKRMQAEKNSGRLTRSLKQSWMLSRDRFSIRIKK